MDRIREGPAAAIRLVTIGAVIALAGTAAAVRFVLDVPWDLSLVIGSLLVATGPTVVTPILRVVPVRSRVAAALETEGIVNDVTAAIMAVVFFNRVNPAASVASLEEAFVTRLGVGLLFGVIVAGLVYYLLRYVDLSPGDAPRNARLLVLARASRRLRGGELRGDGGRRRRRRDGRVPPRQRRHPLRARDRELQRRRDVTRALLRLHRSRSAGQHSDAGGGRPRGTARRRPHRAGHSTGARVAVDGRRPVLGGERLFMSVVGPRGSSPPPSRRCSPSVARAEGLETQADVLLGTVFLAILLTAVFQGGFARKIAEYLDVIPMRVIIVGGGKVGRSLAERLEDRGENVVIVEERDRSVESPERRFHRPPG